MFQAALYSLTRVDAAYVSAALAYGWHRVSTDRVLTVAEASRLFVLEADYSWSFVHTKRKESETLVFQPYIAMNDYAGLVIALLEGSGIGELPPIVQPELLRKGLLVEVMPQWHLPIFQLTIAHLRDRYLLSLS